MSFTRVHFEHNVADTMGGALRVLRGELRLSECRFVGNAADQGGGLSIGGTSSVSAVIEGCSFVGNTADIGGGVQVFGLLGGVDAAMLSRCRFAENEARYGAGLSSDFADRVTIERCIFSHNDAEEDGGAVAYTGDFFGSVASLLIVRNSLIADNTAGSAAGLASALGGVVVQGSTVAGNSADSGPGGIDWFFGPGLLVVNSIVWGNRSTRSSALDQQVAASGPLVELLGSDVEGLPPVDTNLSVDPLFVDAGAGNYHLAPMSPCIDAGVPFGLAATQLDIDGQPRLIGAGFDIGADEFAF